MRVVPTIHRYGPGPAQYGELWSPDPGDSGPGTGAGSRGTVVIIHGGFWRARYGLELGRPLAADLAKRGYTAWNLEYRRAGEGGGWPETFDDIVSGIGKLADLEVTTDKVVAIGHSAGGHLAVWAAAQPQVLLTGVISQAGVLTLADCARDHTGDTAAQDLMGGEPDDLPAEYRLADPITAVPAPCPVLCLHSRRDENVPYRYSERYVAESAKAGGEARLLETMGDHFTLITPSSTDWLLAVEALDTWF